VHNLPSELSLRDALAVARAAGRLRTIDPSPSLHQPYTLWEGLIAGTFLALAYFGCDQSQVQRYLSGRSLREMRMSLLFNAAFKIPMQALILFTGAMVFVFYHFHAIPLLWNPGDLRRLQAETPAAEREQLQQVWEAAQEQRRQATLALVHAAPAERAAAESAYAEAERRLEAARGPAVNRVASKGKMYSDTNYVFLTYVLAFLPAGLKGLIIAVVFAAAMSALSGELSALASASMIDFYKRFAPAAPAYDLAVSRALTVFWGCAACLVAMRAGQLGSAIEAVNKLGSYFYGSILGVFALAVLVPRARAAGAIGGLIAGIASVALVARCSQIHFLWYNVVGALVVLLVGGAHSIVARRADMAR
jgi:hypothetical protein